MKHYLDQAIILLAAGNSSRMGTSKQMLFFNNKPLLRNMVEIAMASHIAHIIVVLGANLEEHTKALKDCPVTLAFNVDWEKGMGSSLQTGLKKALELYPAVQGVMVLVCDQPLLSSIHINRLAETYRESQPMAIASQYNGVNGVPAVFDRSVFSNLMRLDVKAGARDVLKKIEKHIVTIPFEGGLIDIDTPEEYRNFIKGKSRKTSSN